jgi:hypothetical protein
VHRRVGNSSQPDGEVESVNARTVLVIAAAAGACVSCRSSPSRSELVASESATIEEASVEKKSAHKTESSAASSRDERAPNAAAPSDATTSSDATPQSNAAQTSNAGSQTTTTTNSVAPSTLDAPIAAPQTKDAALAPDAFPVHGSLSTRYRGRWTEGAHDNDLYATGSLSLGDPTRNAWTGYFLGEADLDLDGKGAGAQSPFFSLQDTYDAALVGRLYAAYVDYHGAENFDLVRFGRQTIYTTPVSVWFDGLSIESKALDDSGLKLGAYGGLAVFAYESFDWSNVLGGAYAEIEPWQGSHARLDYMYLEDEREVGVRAANLLGLGLGQSFGTHVRFDANGTLLDGDARDYTLKATWSAPENDLTLQASYYQLLEAQFSLPLQIDPFSSTLLAQFPYHEVRVMASKGFGDKLGLQGGADFRTVSDASDVSTFNRDFQHGFVTATLSNVLPAKLVLSATADLWYGSGDDITTWGVDLSRKMGDGWSTSIGSYFSMFKFDIVQDIEEHDVRTYYANVHWRQTTSRSWDLRYEYEDDPGFGYFQTLRLGAVWQF